jgi:hypothetical protein
LIGYFLIVEKVLDPLSCLVTYETPVMNDPIFRIAIAPLAFIPEEAKVSPKDEPASIIFFVVLDDVSI